MINSDLNAILNLFKDEEANLENIFEFTIR